MIKGFLANGICTAEQMLSSVCTSDPDAARERLGINVCKDNRAVAAFADVVVLAVKVGVRLDRVTGRCACRS